MTADVTGSPDPISDEARQAAAKALLDEGGGPGNGLHSWRCEYPDRYGPCDCVQEVADLILAAAAPLLVSADSSAQAEPTHYGEAPGGMGWTKHRGLIGECSAPDCADDPDALNARLIAALDASESVVEGLHAELAEREAAITKLRVTHADALADRDAITRVIMRERDRWEDEAKGWERHLIAAEVVVDGLRAELAERDRELAHLFAQLRNAVRVDEWRVPPKDTAEIVSVAMETLAKHWDCGDDL